MRCYGWKSADFRRYEPLMLVKKIQILVIAATLPTVASPVSAIASCDRSPNLNCFLHYIDQRLQADTDSPELQEARLHLQYELDANGIGTTIDISKRSDEYLRIKKILDHEEEYLSLLKEKQFEKAITQVSSVQQPLLDLNSPLPQLLLIEYLTLNLLDETADNIKREMYRQAIEDKSDLSSIIPKVARYEVLGGAPEKGRHTLENTPIDEFSNTTDYHSKQLTLMLSEISHTLFLEPASSTGDCTTQPSQLGQNLKTIFSPEHIALLRNIGEAPDEQQTWQAYIDLINLYKNADVCPLNITLMTQALIQALTQPEHTRQHHNLNLVFTARSIRRYLN